MQRSNKAALLSALLFPGSGQIYLGHRLRGWLIVLVALVSVSYFVNQVLAQVMPLFEEALNGTLAPDPVAIAERLHRQGQDGSTLRSVAAALIIICWVGSTIDAWLLGRRAQ
jgi:hypothetical protein